MGEMENYDEVEHRNHSLYKLICNCNVQDVKIQLKKVSEGIRFCRSDHRCSKSDVVGTQGNRNTSNGRQCVSLHSTTGKVGLKGITATILFRDSNTKNDYKIVKGSITPAEFIIPVNKGIIS
ncbi:hypothetical protein Tsp_12583 [Trichinella spiralis]|uniref:hypothetical protein n=1 Tax=Trichinella spiralis TaxID=6334 RepID=UPI0001EFE5C7|nr:hypothetical protein Tsp_12583 [Trichinella spiralis]